MPLTPSTITLLSQLVGMSYVAVEAAVPVATASLSAPAVAAIEAELAAIAAAYSPVKDSSFEMGGGKDGINLSEPEEVKSMRRRARTLLGMAAGPAEEGAPFCGVFRGVRWF